MRFFYDTEFLEDGHTIELISIGIVREDGREYYAVSADAPWERISNDDWLVRNVVPSLPVINRTQLEIYIENPSNRFPRPPLDVRPDTTNALVKPRWVIANEVRDFILNPKFEEPDLWAWYAAYDHVALCQLWGRMINLPTGIPMFTHDLKQVVHDRDIENLPKQATGEHNALEDARHLRAMFKHVREQSGAI